MSAIPTLELVKQPSDKADAVIVGLVGATPTLVGVTPELEKALARRFSTSVLELALDLGASSDPSKVVVLPSSGQRLVVVGLGDADTTPEQVRRSTGAAVRELASRGTSTGLRVAVSLETTDPELVKAAAEGAVLGAYTFAKVLGVAPKPGVTAVEIVSASTRGDARDAVDVAREIAAAVCTARDWINTPANALYPASFAALAKEHLKSTKVDIEVLDEQALEKQGYGGILAVGQGSSRKPRLMRVDYHPRGAKFHLNLVGKGITFDSGGLNLKPADGMYTMKCDMSGAAAVLAAVKAIAALGYNVWVTAYAAMAENLPSDTAYRPSDVLTMFGGMTVENVNCDAEGRLVMADALTRSVQDSPGLIVDVATLTGACMIALGTRTAGLMASDDATADIVLDAAEVAGEEVWQLPIPEHLRKELDSKVADCKSGGPREGGALIAAAFLQKFTGDLPWAHLDIAGPAWNAGKEYDYVPAGGTGAAVRTLVALAAALQG